MKKKASLSHGEKLFSSLTDVEDRYVEEAVEPLEKRAKSRGWAVRMVTACLCLALGAGVLIAALATFQPQLFARSQPEASLELEPGHRWPVKVITLDPENVRAEPLAAFVPPWDEWEIYRQYSTIPLDGTDYGSTGAQVPEDRLGQELGRVTAEGWDDSLEGEDCKKTLRAEVREISGISQNCAIAVRYDGTEEWYSAQKREYDPQTLGQFIEDLNLRENLALGTVTYGYWPDGEYAEVTFDSVGSGKIWELLLSHTEAENVCRNLSSGDFYTLFDPEVGEPAVILGISAGIPLLGEENLALQVREDGYLWTNLMGMTEKAFQIGEENTQAFVDYVLNQCEGYEYRYVFPEQPQDREPVDSSTVSYIATPEGLIPADQFGSESQAVASAPSVPAENPGFSMWEEARGTVQSHGDVELSVLEVSEDNVKVLLKNTGDEDVAYTPDDYTLAYCQDGTWYFVYRPDVIKDLGAVLPAHGEAEMSCPIPLQVLDCPGRYRLYIVSLGYCEFESPH